MNIWLQIWRCLRSVLFSFFNLVLVGLTFFSYILGQTIYLELLLLTYIILMEERIKE